MSSSDVADGETLARLAENERHFHTIQAGIRGLASSWVLAAFASIALLLQAREGSTWLFHPLPLVIVICLMANCGLSVLWIIDQLVYQRLFNTNYLAGLRLEQQFSFIPPVRAIQAFTTRGRSIAFWVEFFYAAPLVAFAIIALAAAILSDSMDSINRVVMVVGALLGTAPLVWVVYQARAVSFFSLAASLPGDFATILEKENCRAIIDRHLNTLNGVNARADNTR